MERSKKINKEISEKRLADVLVSHIRKCNPVKREYRHYEKYIDLIGLVIDRNELMSVEIKVKNWQKAFQQAVVNLAVAEKSYVAIYSEYIHRVDLDRLRTCGIGLISVGSVWGEVQFIEPAKSSRFINTITNKRIKERLCISGA